MCSFRCITLPKKTLETIINSGNSYLIQAKGNQPTLLTDIKKVTSIATSVCDSHETTETNRGRLEIRRVSTFKVENEALQEIWKDLKSYIKVERLCEEKGLISLETSFFVSNLTTVENNAIFFYKGIRDHWRVENDLHYVKDVVHKEDDNRLSNKGAVISSIASSIAINISRKNAKWSIEDSQIIFCADISKTIKYIRT